MLEPPMDAPLAPMDAPTPPRPTRPTPPPKTPPLFTPPLPMHVQHYTPTLMEPARSARHTQVSCVKRREPKKTDHGYNSFAQLNKVQNLVCSKRRPSQRETNDALASLRDTIMMDLQLVNKHASQRNRKLGAAKYSELQRKIEALQLDLGAFKEQAQNAELRELNMSLFSIDENADAYGELEELALEANLLNEEDIMDCLVSDIE